MTMEEFRDQLETFWASAIREAHDCKDPFLALDRLFTLYRSLDPVERELAHQVLAEWLVSDDETKRFVAVALVREFRVVTAAPALRQLSDQLQRCDGPGAPFERRKVEDLLSEFRFKADGR
ncbi:MAG: hypothetical protein WKF96_17075 [Solirubrobacteraceae bacterium]